MGGWEHLSHGADIGLCGRGTTVEEAFEQAALALTAIVADPGRVEATHCISIECDAPDRETLFVEWLNAVIYEMAVRKMLFGRFQVTLEGEHLRANAWGERVDVSKHHPAVEPKGATYTQLAVEKESSTGWVARCVVDV